MSEQAAEKNRIGQAKDAFIEGDYEKARNLLLDYLEDNPGNPQALKNLTSIQIKLEGSPDQNIKKQIRKIYDLYDTGYQYFRDKDYDSCLTSFKEVIDEGERSEFVSHFIATAEDLIAEIEIEREVQENNNQIQALFSEGREFFYKEMYDECIEKMMSVLSIDPGHEEAVKYINEAAQLKES